MAGKPASPGSTWSTTRRRCATASVWPASTRLSVPTSPAEGTPADLKARMGSTVIELGFEHESGADRSVEVVSRLVAGHPERDGSTLRLTSDDGPRVLIEVLRSLDAAGLVPVTLTVRQPS